MTDKLSMNCNGTGTYARHEPNSEQAICSCCPKSWPASDLIGGKIPPHREVLRVVRSSEPELLDIEAAERASRRDG